MSNTTMTALKQRFLALIRAFQEVQAKVYLKTPRWVLLGE
jgi:hypothetical protein